MRRALLLIAVAFLAGCSSGDGTTGVDPESLSGGATTVFESSSNAYRLPAPNLGGASLARHREGDVAFDRTFITAPASPFGGLGPLFNDTSCSGCHVNNGRGSSSVLVRVSRGGIADDGGPIPVAGYGLQVQDRAVLGRRREAVVTETDEVLTGSYPDGKSYTLQRRRFVLGELYQPIDGPIATSPRIPPPVFGLGLLEAIPAGDILAGADEFDRDGDGISGRPNFVTDAATSFPVLGRFGWKANQPTLRQQTAAAYNGDMGITTTLFPEENSHGQASQLDSLSDDPELAESVVDITTFYVQSLGVPARRDLDDPEVRRGLALFNQIGCASCHQSEFRTGSTAAVSELAGQTIHPYTDLLLHDMGEELADDRIDYLASGREWRTAPLWGIGLLRTVNGLPRLLHDGRASTLEEAILWHGGEAAAVRDRFTSLPVSDRRALIRFVSSL